MRKLVSLIFACCLSFTLLAQQPSSVTNTTFNAIARGKQVLLSWNPQEGSGIVYQLEKSHNGTEFTTFSQVQANQNVTEFLETDFNPYEGLSYYRIKMTNSDGMITYSNTVPVKYNENGEPVSPVPAQAEASKNSDQSVLVVVRNANGEEFYSKIESLSNGNPVEGLNPDPELVSGRYTIIGCSDQNYYCKELVVK